MRFLRSLVHLVSTPSLALVPGALWRRLRVVLCLAMIAIMGLLGSVPARTQEETPEAQGDRVLTIYAVTCPVRDDGGFDSVECAAHPAVGVGFLTGMPYTEGDGIGVITDNNGFASFPYVMVGLGDAVRIFEQVPAGISYVDVLCGNEDGERLDVLYEGVQGWGNPLGVVDVLAGSHGDVTCVFRNVPVPPPSEGGPSGAGIDAS
jgi:hypothetical protein